MLRALVPIYTRNMDLVESQFLYREFNLQLTEINETNLETINQERIVLFATTNPFELKEIIERRNASSVIIFLLGNETYDVPTFEYLNKYNEKLCHVFIYNYPKKTSYLVTIKCFLGTLYDGGLFFKDGGGNIFRHFKNGFDFMRRNRKIKINYSHSEFPLGYTKVFTRELEKLIYNLDEGSLVNGKILTDSINNRSQSMTFIGAEGSWSRRLAVRKMKTLIPNSKFKSVDNIYNAEKNLLQTEYTESLKNSRFALCPPGNITNKTFRYLESILMGSLPILPPSTIQDNHHWSTWPEYTKPIYYSWTKNIIRAIEMNEAERLKLLSLALNNEKKIIFEVTKKLNEILA